MPSSLAISAARARGSMFLVGFGSAWVLAWATLSYGMRPLILGPIALLGCIGMWVCLRRYLAGKSEYLAASRSPQQLRSTRLFNYVNVAQWVVILVGANVLLNTGLGAWATPFVILIVGLHFFPISAIFQYAPHLVTGLALVAWAVVYPLLVAGGPSDPIGCLGAGIILLLSAARSMTGGWAGQAVRQMG